MELAVRRAGNDQGKRLTKVGGRLLGRYWYNAVYGGARISYKATEGTEKLQMYLYTDRFRMNQSRLAQPKPLRLGLL